MTTTEPFSLASILSRGFCEPVPLTAVRDHRITDDGGVYLVLRPSLTDAQYRENGSGGHFKGRNPNVSLQVLEANWVPGTQIVYIGKANRLKRRLRELVDFGTGKPIGHWGGRLIWQLADTHMLQATWMATPGMEPRGVENSLLAEFRRFYGKPPFANYPNRLGK